MIQTPQMEVDELRLSIIRKRENEIMILKQKRENITDEIKIQEEYLMAYKKTIPTVHSMRNIY